ncbi:MAG: hypothetical protein ACK4XJ_03040 [Fimbriimonadaceae bacterium]
MAIERWNSEAIPRHELSVTLQTPHLVMAWRRAGRCMLCCRQSVNEAGLCEICTATLDGDEFDLASKWLRGTGP